MCGVLESNSTSPGRCQATSNAYKALKIRGKSIMHPPRSIPLYPNPPFSPRQTQADPSDESDFPPIHVGASTPDPPTCSSTQPRLHSECSSPSQLELQSTPRWRSQRPKKGLGHKNIVNNVRVTVKQSKVRHQNMFTGGYTDDYQNPKSSKLGLGCVFSSADGILPPFNAAMSKPPWAWPSNFGRHWRPKRRCAERFHHLRILSDDTDRHISLIARQESPLPPALPKLCRSWTLTGITRSKSYSGAAQTVRSYY